MSILGPGRSIDSGTDADRPFSGAGVGRPMHARVGDPPAARIATPWTTVLADPWVAWAIFAAIAIRLTGLDAAPLWFDEAVTAKWIGMGWGDMVRRVAADYHPPLYFLLVKAWSEIAGSSPWALRLPSALMSWAAVPLIAATASTLVGRSAARWTAWLAACSPFLLHHAQEMRMYPLVGTLAAAHLLQLARYVNGDRRALGWLFVATAAALVGSHYYAIFFVGGEMLVLLALRPRPISGWLPASVATVLVIMIALAWAVLLPTHRPVSQYHFGGFAVPGVVWSLLAGYTFLPSSEELHTHGWRAVFDYLPIALAGALALASAASVGLRELSTRARVVVLLPLVAALVGPFAVGLILPGGLNPRYFATAMSPFLILLGAGAAGSLTSRPRALAVVALFALMITGCVRHLMDPGHGREDVRAAALWLDTHVPLDETTLVTSDEMAELARYHWPTRRLQVYPAPGIVVTADTAAAVVDALPTSGTGRIIYVFGRAWLSDPAGALQQELMRRFRSCGGAEVRGVRILCFDPSAAAQANSAADVPVSAGAEPGAMD